MAADPSKMQLATRVPKRFHDKFYSEAVEKGLDISKHLLALLAGRYPELAEEIERERIARVRAILGPEPPGPATSARAVRRRGQPRRSTTAALALSLFTLAAAAPARALEIAPPVAAHNMPQANALHPMVILSTKKKRDWSKCSCKLPLAA